MILPTADGLAGRILCVALSRAPFAVKWASSLSLADDSQHYTAAARAACRWRRACQFSHCARKRVGRYAVSVEIEGKEKPALVAEWLTIAFLG